MYIKLYKSIEYIHNHTYIHILYMYNIYIYKYTTVTESVQYPTHILTFVPIVKKPWDLGQKWAPRAGAVFIGFGIMEVQ